MQKHFPMVIIAILFFIFGFVTWLNGSLIPFLKLILDLTTSQALFVTFAFYIAYTVMAFPMAWVLERTGYKNGMAWGLAIMALGSLLFIPAALNQSFAIFLLGLFTMGTGLTILQTTSNPYVIHLGDVKSAAMRISIMGIINKGAGVIAPIVFTALVLADLQTFDTSALTPEQIELLAQKMIMPYIVMALILLALIGLIKFAHIPDLAFEEESDEKTNILAFPRVVLGALAIFFYVGVEVIAGDTIGLYGESLHLTNFATLTSYTMIFMVIGYALGIGLIPHYLSQEKALLFSALAGIALTIAILFSSQESHAIASVLWGWSGIATLPDSITFVALLGLANALVWPTVWPLALDGLGKYTAQGSALLIMGIAGGALLPMVYGQFAQMFSMQVGYFVLFVGYGFILYYALWGHKKNVW